MVRAMCGIALRDRKRFMDLILVLNETTDWLAMANSVHWYGHVLRREDGHVLRKVLHFKVESQKKKGRHGRIRFRFEQEDALC